MPIDVILQAPDFAGSGTSITLKAAKVAQRIQRVVDINAIPSPDEGDSGEAVKVDLNIYIKQFTITASVTAGGVLDKTQYEALESASQTWSTIPSNEGLTLFRYSTRDDGGNKDYRVVWLSLDFLEDVEQAPQVYTATIVLQEAHVSGGSYTISGTAT
jgi:hypothetical protein